MSDVTQGITYFWQVTSRDSHGIEALGPVWRFTTDGDPPDLVVSSMATNPAGHLQSGQSITFIAYIQNTGNGPVVDPFSVNFVVDGVSIGTVSVDQILLAGETVPVSQIWTYTGGDPTVEVTADNHGQVTETDESNNSFMAKLSIIADNTAPALVATSPENGSAIQQVQQITASLVDSQGTVDDAAVIASFSVKNSSQQSIAGTISEFNDTFTFVPNSLPLPDDIYQVELIGADTYGNMQTYMFHFIIDTQPPPKPTITGGTVDSGTIQPRPAQNTTSQFFVALTGTREAGTSVWVNGLETVAFGDADWLVQLTLLPGINAVEIWLKDKAGNQGTSEWVDFEVVTANQIHFDYDSSGRTMRIHSNP